MRVAAIQPGLPVAAHLDKIHTPEERIQILSDLTLQAAQEAAELIVWPEMGLGFDPQREYTRELQDLAEKTQAYLVLGYVVEDQIGFRNQAVLVSPEGEFMAVYSKTHPMLASGEPRSLESGRFPVVDTPIGRIGMMICFDNSFTDVARALGKQKVQVIANPSLLGPSIADLMPPMGVFRSLETRSAVIMADTAYKSAIFDPWGRMLASTSNGIEEPAILVADLTIRPGGSFSSILGDILGWASILCLVVLGISDFCIRLIHSRTKPEIQTG
jgi:apolipoprotein N-acyltransferase